MYNVVQYNKLSAVLCLFVSKQYGLEPTGSAVTVSCLRQLSARKAQAAWRACNKSSRFFPLSLIYRQIV